jgi:hypothetical protein
VEELQTARRSDAVAAELGGTGTVNWLARKAVDGYRALANKVYARRYGTIARQLGLDDVAEPRARPVERGFIVIQVDGLAYDHLVQALARGSAPYIKRLVGAGRLRLASWHCGLPSTTPAVQAGIMYGQNWDIPGFRWYEKSVNRAVVCKLPAALRALQKYVSTGRSGILDGGSSYFNMFDGGAEWSVFTLSTLRAPRFFAGVRGLSLMLLFLLSPLRVLRVMRLAIWNYLLDVGRRMAAIFRPSDYRPLDLISPMTQIIVRVLFQEIITFGVQIDIYRGARAIYLNNVAYDEVAHHLGPTHPAAFRAINAIDRQVAQIDKMVTRYGQRSYDLYILSDHGMSPSVPFKKRYDQSLGDYILEQIGEPLIMDERWGAPDHALTQAQFLVDELHSLEERLSPRSATVVRAAREYINRRLPGTIVDEPLAINAAAQRGRKHNQDHWDPGKHSDVAVRVSGPLAHVYFNLSDQRLNVSDIALLYPTLLTRLIEHPGIGLVVGREGAETVMLGSEGTLAVHSDLDRLRGTNPLSGLSEPPDQAARIDRVASFPRAGDLMLLGAWDNGTVVTFEDQSGTHGGLGGPQEKPFILYPAEIELPSGTIKSPCDLYPVFARYLEAASDTATEPHAPQGAPASVSGHTIGETNA